MQAAHTYDDTFYMFASAAANPQIIGVVGWVPLERPQEACTALDFFMKNLLFKGVRNLTHDYGNLEYQSDDTWITRSSVSPILKANSDRNLSFDYVAIKPEHTCNIPVIAEKLPSLRIIIDHFAKPDIKENNGKVG